MRAVMHVVTSTKLHTMTLWSNTRQTNEVDALLSEIDAVWILTCADTQCVIALIGLDDTPTSVMGTRLLWSW